VTDGEPPSLACGIAGVVLAIAGVVIGIGPAVLYIIPLALGIIAIALGVIGWRRAKHEYRVGRKGMAKWPVGVGLGVLACTFALLGAVQADEAGERGGDDGDGPKDARPADQRGEVVEAVKSFQKTALDRDASAYCNRLTGVLKRETTKKAAPLGAKSCEDAANKAFKLVGGDEYAQIRKSREQLDTGDVRLTGNRATVTLPVIGQRIQLDRVSGAWYVSELPGRSAVPAPEIMRPFPIVRIVGRSTGFGARIKLLVVRGAPRGAKVTVRCRGRRCRLRPRGKYVRFGSARFRSFERRVPAGVRIQVFVTQPGRIGKYTSFKIRRTRPPLREDLCVTSVRAKPRRCPM
jgi:hypothetical protein